jgi:hypothetical protein
MSRKFSPMEEGFICLKEMGYWCTQIRSALMRNKVSCMSLIDVT